MRRSSISKILKFCSVFLLSFSLLVSHLFLFKSKVAAQSVTDPTVITPSSTIYATSHSTQRKIVKTSEGTIHAFIQTGSTTMDCQQPTPAGSKSGLLWVTSSDEGSTWSCQGQLDSGATIYASATVDSSENIYVVYSKVGGTGGGTQPVNYRKFTKGVGSSWTMESAQTALTTAFPDDDYLNAVLELEGTTRLWIATRYFQNNMGVNAVAWNSSGSYWLIGGGDWRLNKYDGSTFTDVSSNLSGWATLSLVEVIAWNGTNFLIGGEDKELNLCDGNLSCSDVSSSLTAFESYDDVFATGWNGTVWLIGGQGGELMECNSDVTSCTDKSTSLVNWSGQDVNAVFWDSTNSFWLIGGDSAKLNEYDGTTFTDKSGSLVNFGTNHVNTIAFDSTDDYSLIGGLNKSLNKYDGTTFTDVSGNLDANWATTDDIFWLKFGGSYWLIAGYNQFSKCDGSLTCTAVTTTSQSYGAADWNGSVWLIGTHTSNFFPQRSNNGNSGGATATNRLKKYDLTTITNLGDSLVNFGNNDWGDYRLKTYYSDGLSAAPTWTESAELTTPDGSSNNHYPSIVRFGTNIGVIYTMGGTLKWRKRADTDALTSWDTEAQLFAGAGNTPMDKHSATVDSSNNVHVVTLLNSQSSNPCPLRYAYYNGTSWSTPVDLETSGVVGGMIGTVQITTDGSSVWVLYPSNTNIAGATDVGKIVYKKGVSLFGSANFDATATALNSSDRTYDQVWSYVSSTYSDETADAANTTTADTQMVTGVGDILYFGMTEKFRVVNVQTSTNGVGGVIAWEYWNGSTWTSLTLTGSFNPNFTMCSGSAGCGVWFNSPSDWAQTQVNTDASPGFYYVRARVTTAYTTTPVGTQLRAIPRINSLSAIKGGTDISNLYIMWAENIYQNTPVNIQFAYIATNQNPNPPSSLGPSSLVDGSFETDNTPTLTFTLSDPDDSEQVKFQIQIDDSSDFSSVVVDYTSTFQSEGSASFTVGQAAGSGSYTTGSEGQTLSDGSYYWRVKTIDDDNAESAYTMANSGNIAFKVDTSAPSKPGTPSTISPTFDKTPSWSWSTSTDTGTGLRVDNTYKVQWSKNPSFGSGVSLVFTNTNSFTHSSSLSAGTWYFKVRAFDALGNSSAWSNRGSVTIKAPSVTEEEPLIEEVKEEKEEEEEIIEQLFFNIIIRVVDENGNPIEGARVELYSEPEVAYTDSLGESWFSEVEKGYHRILVFFRDQKGEATIHVGPRPGEVAAAEEGPEIIIIQLEPIKPDLVISPKLVVVILASYLLGVLTTLFVFRKGQRRGQ